MAALLFPNFDHEFTLEAPLDAVDAALAVIHQLQRDRGLSVMRGDNIPGKLVVYVFTVYMPGQNLGDCGRVYLKYLDEKKTRMSIQVASPDDYHAARFVVNGKYNDSDQLNLEQFTQDDLNNGSHNLRTLRRQFLMELCDSVARRVAPAQDMDLENHMEGEFGRENPGRPGLPQEEKLRRLALVVLERKLKQKDPGFTRAEFVYLVQKNLKMIVETHTIKNAARLYDQTINTEDQDLLSAVERKAQEWLELIE
jgi:hypothetical protein